VCNGTVHLTDQYNSSASRVYVLSHNGTVVEFTTVDMNRLFSVTFDLTNSDRSFNGIALNYGISEWCVTIVVPSTQ
jgi:hypothetical protein